jgi:hypothetical protein
MLPEFLVRHAGPGRALAITVLLLAGKKREIPTPTTADATDTRYSEESSAPMNVPRIRIKSVIAFFLSTV